MWPEVLAKFEASGETIAGFCAGASASRTARRDEAGDVRPVRPDVDANLELAQDDANRAGRIAAAEPLHCRRCLLAVLPADGS